MSLNLGAQQSGRPAALSPASRPPATERGRGAASLLQCDCGEPRGCREGLRLRAAQGGQTSPSPGSSDRAQKGSAQGAGVSPSGGPRVARPALLGTLHIGDPKVHAWSSTCSWQRPRPRDSRAHVAAGQGRATPRSGSPGEGRACSCPSPATSLLGTRRHSQPRVGLRWCHGSPRGRSTCPEGHEVGDQSHLLGRPSATYPFPPVWDPGTDRADIILPGEKEGAGGERGMPVPNL